eukprot:jgi/Undpi1/5511/HiC_scaffold_2.g00790.m1
MFTILGGFAAAAAVAGNGGGWGWGAGGGGANFYFFSMAFSDDWEVMTVAGVRSYASSSATQDYGTVWNLRLSSSLILKLFPDVLIYWIFLYVIAMVAVVARAWRPVFGVGWETMMAYHRGMARVFMALVLVHMVLFWVVFAQNDDFWHDWPIAIPTDYHSDNWTIPLATLTTWVALVVMFGFSLEWVRRRNFELFYYSHHFFLVIWAMVLWHAASAWYYIGASIALWIVDRAIRFSSVSVSVSVSVRVSVRVSVTVRVRIWSTRSVDEIGMLERELQDVVTSEGGVGNGRFSVHLHMTTPFMPAPATAPATATATPQLGNGGAMSRSSSTVRRGVWGLGATPS